MAKKPFPSKKAPVKSRQNGVSKSAEAATPIPENAADTVLESATTKRAEADRKKKAAMGETKKHPMAEMQNKASLGAKTVAERTVAEKAAAENAAAEKAMAEKAMAEPPVHVEEPLPIQEPLPAEEAPASSPRPSLFIVHITPEMAPIAKVDGLADVVFGITRELAIRGNHVEIILPKYDNLRYDHIWELHEDY